MWEGGGAMFRSEHVVRQASGMISSTIVKGHLFAEKKFRLEQNDPLLVQKKRCCFENAVISTAFSKRRGILFQ